MSRAQIVALWALQQLDIESDRAAAEHEALRQALATDATRATRAALAESTRQANARAREAREAEMALQDTQERLKRQETRLYGGGASPKELAALQQEIAHLQATRATQEEAVLMAMMAQEEAQALVAERQRALDAVEQAQTRGRADETARLANLDTHLQALRGQREARVAAIPADLLARYDGLRRSRGRALAAAREGICQGCRVSLTPATLQRARAASELVTCGNCGRILYLE